MNAAIDALSRKWYVAIAVFALGTVFAVAAYLDNAAGLIAYLATSQLSVVNAPVSGVDLPCTPAGAVAIAKYVSALPANRVSADLPAPNILAMHYAGADRKAASDGVNAAATNLVKYCQAATQKAVSAATTAMTSQLTQFEQQLGPLDTHVSAAKARSALATQSDALKTKLISLNAALSTAQTQLAAAIPIARSEIEQADPTFVQLKKRLDADVLTYAQVASEYRSTYARVAGLANRVTVDRQQVQARANELEGESLEQSAAYRTALAAQTAAQTAVDVANKQLADLSARIAHLDRVLKQSTGGTSATLSQQAIAKTYQDTVTASAKLQLQAAQIPPKGPVQVLTTATPAQAVETGRLRAAALSLVLAVVSLLLGIVLAVLIGLLDRRLLTVPQFTKLYGKPVIATLHPKK